MERSTADFIEILEVLCHHNVEFIIVGGVCAVLHGAPITTFDLDIVYNREKLNINSLAAALNDLDAIYRGRGRQRIRPTEAHLAAAGHLLLLTRAGPLDVLATIGHNHLYNNLLNRTVSVTVESLELLMLDLPDLVAIKSETIRDRDKHSIAILRIVLKDREQNRSDKT